MEQKGSPSEEIREPPSANDLEKDQMIEDLRSENKHLKEMYKELEKEYEKLKTENDDLLEAINNQNQVQTEGSTSADTSNRSGSFEGKNRERLLAETSAPYIFQLLEMSTQSGNKPIKVTITKENDVNHMDQIRGLYVCYLKTDTENSAKKYPIYVGVGQNLRHIFQGHIYKKNHKGEVVPGFVRNILVSKTFPKNSNVINLDPKLYVIILKLEDSSMNLLKLILLNHFDFCLNRYHNNNIRTTIVISDQSPTLSTARWIRLKGLWKDIIDECNAFNSSHSALGASASEDDI